MFTLPTSRDERIGQILAQRVCTAEDGSYIRRSNGRCQAGRPAKYFVHLVSGDSFTVKAFFDDDKAVDAAYQRLMKV